MDESVDVQGQVIALGALVAVAVLAYGTITNGTVAGYEPFTLTMWAFAATFGLLAGLHLLFGRADMALASGGAAFGWWLLLAGETGGRIVLGFVLFLLGGVYMVRLTLSERDATPSE